MKYPRRRGELTQQRISAWKGSLQFSLIHLLSFLNLEQQQARISVPGTVWVAKYRALLETKTFEFPMLEWLRKCRKKFGRPKIESRLVGVQQWQRNDKETLVDLGKYSMIPNSGALLYFTLPLSSTSRIQEQMSQYCVNFGITRIWHDRIAFKL